MEVCHLLYINNVIIDDSRQLLQMLPFVLYILIEPLFWGYSVE